MANVFLKTDCEPDSELAFIENCIGYFLSLYTPTTKVDTTYNKGDVVVNLTPLNRHVGAAGYHVLLNGVPTAFVYPTQVGGLNGVLHPAHWSIPIYATVLGKRIVIRPSKMTIPDRFEPGAITILCHEIAEALSDGDIATYTKPDQLGRVWLKEVADWVEGTYFTKTIQGQVIVFPNIALEAFCDVTNKVGPYDLMGLVKAPFQCVGKKAQAYGKINNGPLTKIV